MFSPKKVINLSLIIEIFWHVVDLRRIDNSRLEALLRPMLSIVFVALMLELIV